MLSDVAILSDPGHARVPLEPDNYHFYRFIKPTLAKILAYSFCETFSLWEECVSKERIVRGE